MDCECRYLANAREQTATLCDGVTRGPGALLDEVIEDEWVVDTSTVLEHPGGDISLPLTDDGPQSLAVTDALDISSVLSVGCCGAVCVQLR